MEGEREGGRERRLERRRGHRGFQALKTKRESRVSIKQRTVVVCVSDVKERRREKVMGIWVDSQCSPRETPVVRHSVASRHGNVRP